MDHVPDVEQPRDGYTGSTPPGAQSAEQPTASSTTLYERVTGALLPAVIPFETSRGWRIWPWRRPPSPPAAVILTASVAAAVLLIAVVLSGLGTYGWTAFGLAAIPRPTASDMRAELATPAPTPTATPTPPPDPTLELNAAMGCADGPPAASPQAIYAGRNFQTGGPTPNEIALTFDDGPTPFTSPPILDFLERTHTPATFFVMGQFARAWPDLVHREWRDGFAIGVHTWDHPSMPLVPDSQMAHQFGDTLVAIHAAIGEGACVWLWRPPYGDHDARVVGFARRYGLTTIMWNDDPRDWSRPGPQAIAATALAEARPGGIIVMHDGPAHREQTAAALPLILDGLRARGLVPVTVPRLLADGHYPGVNMNLSHQHTPNNPTSAPSSPSAPPPNSTSTTTASDALMPTLATWDGGE